ncbi:MAG TPA: hypothetical protein PKU74_05610 [Candidatus Omnitrophota bacterium]|nr:hypothetical protein [Candidatus Omnitrophota bacterium]
MQNSYSKANQIIVAFSLGSCSLLSAYFTVAGARYYGYGGGIPVPFLRDLPMPLWILWGLLWRGACGLCGGRLLSSRLSKARNALWGLWYGLLIGLLVGTVNGALTCTVAYGIQAGLILGPVFGLMLGVLFWFLTLFWKA